MDRRRWLLAIALLGLLAPRGSAADEVRYFEKDGVTYCETRRVVKQQVPEIHYEQRPQTVYLPRESTELRESTRTYWTPVTERKQEPTLVGRWNPFATPHFENRSVERTRWEQRTEVVKTPVTCRQLVPETRTACTPVTAWRTVEQEVITRVAVSGVPSAVSVANVAPPARFPPPSAFSAAPPATLPTLAPVRTTPAGPMVPVEIPELARRARIGGVSRLESDPPRKGVAASPAENEFLRR